MYCRKCGNKISAEVKFCPKCGCKIEESNLAPKIDIKKRNVEENSKKEKLNQKANETETQEEVYKKVTTIDKKKEHPINKQYKSPNNVRKNKLLSKISCIIILIALIVIGVVFRNDIKYLYYKSKYNKSVDLEIKQDYAEKAFESKKNKVTKKMMSDSLVALSESNSDYAEERLNEIKEKITSNDYKELASVIKANEVSKLCKKSDYEEAFKKLSEINNLGQDIRKNKNYDEIMLNICAKLTDNSVKSSKNLLLEEDNIYYGNLGTNNDFDYIVEAKSSDSTYNSKVAINLYSYNSDSGKYESVDIKNFYKAYGAEIKGEYVCDKVDDKDKKGLYIYYQESDSSSYTTYKVISVIKVGDDNKLSTIATIKGNKGTDCDDFNNDGIYEVFSESTNEGGWYKVSWNGETPQKIANENGEKATDSKTTGKGSTTTNLKTSDYIFSDSNTRYLSDYDLQGLDKNTLALARNEIFARHGYKFTQEPFVTYFNNKTWYTPNANFTGDDSELNKYEIANYKKIQEWEAK